MFARALAAAATAASPLARAPVLAPHAVAAIGGVHQRHRPLSSSSSSSSPPPPPPPPADPVLDVEALRESLLGAAPAMAEGLAERGHYCTGPNFLPAPAVEVMRGQAVALRSLGRYVPSWSERIGTDGTAVRFEKEGVHACEPDGEDYGTAPDLVTYMAVLLGTLPPALNGQPATAGAALSAAAFNAKLAVTSPGGSSYPLHVDNPQGLGAGDVRKLTCILYLNPNYRDGDGGELRLHLDGGDDDDDDDDGGGGGAAAASPLERVDLAPLGGRLLLFWSDEIPHEVLPTAPGGRPDDATLDRYALTVWIPTDSAATAIHSSRSRFRHLRDLAF